MGLDARTGIYRLDGGRGAQCPRIEGAVDGGLGHVGEAEVVVAGVAPQPGEGLIQTNSSAFADHALGLLDHHAAGRRGQPMWHARPGVSAWAIRMRMAGWIGRAGMSPMVNHRASLVSTWSPPGLPLSGRAWKHT